MDDEKDENKKGAKFFLYTVFALQIIADEIEHAILKTYDYLNISCTAWNMQCLSICKNKAVGESEGSSDSCQTLQI